MDSDTFPLFARHRAWKLGHRGTSVFAAALSFTLVEMLVAITILTVLLLLASQIITKTTSVWTYANYKMTQGREARVAFIRTIIPVPLRTTSQALIYADPSFDLFRDWPPTSSRFPPG
jgi:prepilin-type N-terminal cleavage/methylation domain-containing protein